MEERELLVEKLKDVNVFIKDEERHIDVLFKNNGYLDMETYYSFLKKNEKFYIYKISRGESSEINVFIDQTIAVLYLVLVIKTSELYTKDEEGDYVYNHVNSENAEEIISRYINKKYYSLFKEKKSAINITIENNIFIIYLIDDFGCKKILSDDNPNIELGLSVLFNYAREYMLIEQEIQNWGINKKEYPEIEKIYSSILGY
ncbi:hypothetical protein [Listeria grayi]|uniref:hypothetical protein n=1 Tax=Listeria grayi TaxID=1641 RepID=UPI0016282F57|nr:hypothetical protein [Listeria grayi]MBC1922099.1 hypothetical protein [Listeria grayi]